MKLNFRSTLLYLLLTPLLFNCSGNSDRKAKVQDVVAETVTVPQPGNETIMLLKDIEESGDYVNSQNFPSLIKASIVYEELGSENLVIDLRIPEKFRQGHIKGAINKIFSDLPDYFETGIKPFEYNRIILICDDGQVSSYTTSLLRLMGYGNVFAMRWGMGGWNKKYAETEWLNNVSGKYETTLEVSTSEAPLPTAMPDFKTGKNSGNEVSDERFRLLFEEGTEKILISADEVFSDPSKYFVINLERKDKYDDGHIPGAVRYKPESTLGFVDAMSTIPSNKTVVVYCGTGHNSAFASAFLRLFGYDARTLKYGNNSFMYDKMVKQRAVLSWLPFTLSDAGEFPVVR